jgi:hypothetical protein
VEHPPLERLHPLHAGRRLYPNFSGTPTSGSSPLTVQFTDQTYTSDPNGVATWLWDFDNDGTVDSTAQNPSHTYRAGGSYTVSLTVADGTHGMQTETKTDYIAVDPDRRRLHRDTDERCRALDGAVHRHDHRQPQRLAVGLRE